MKWNADPTLTFKILALQGNGKEAGVNTEGKTEGDVEGNTEGDTVVGPERKGGLRYSFAKLRLPINPF